jgi:hypothetical protein
MIQRKPTINYETYQETTRQANMICRRNKKEMIQKELEESEKYNEHNERRKFYKAINQEKNSTMSDWM